MGRYVSVEKYVEVDVDMDDFDDEAIVDELERRGLGSAPLPGDNQDLLTAIFQKRRTGQSFEQELDQLIYNSLGRIA